MAPPVRVIKIVEQINMQPGVVAAIHDHLATCAYADLEIFALRKWLVEQFGVVSGFWLCVVYPLEEGPSSFSYAGPGMRCEVRCEVPCLGPQRGGDETATPHIFALFRHVYG
jgi:hypothetical protein